MFKTRRWWWILAGAAVLGVGACETRNEVVVLGMIHGGHRESETYGIEQLAEAIRRIDPDYVLVEIPPDRIEAATVEFRETGEITEARVRVFPEYVDVLFPLTREIDFEIIACAAWTRPMADARRAKLTEWRTSRPEQLRKRDDIALVDPRRYFHSSQAASLSARIR